MSIAVSGTSITFPDSTSQTTAFSSAYNAVGSYVFGCLYSTSASATSGSTYSAGAGDGQVRQFGYIVGSTTSSGNNLSGTWRYMGCTINPGSTGGVQIVAIFVRTA